MLSELLHPFLPAGMLTRTLPRFCKNTVLLTFDDGPVRGVLEEVLVRLETYKAKALFFMIGEKCAASPDLVQEAIRRGHLVGNHSWSHQAERWPWPGRWLRDMKRSQAAIEECTGISCRFFRAPFGHIHGGSLLLPFCNGGTHVNWSLDTSDWKCRNADEARIIGRETAARAQESDIILLHDFSPLAIPLLDELLPALVSRHFDLAGGVSCLGAKGMA